MTQNKVFPFSHMNFQNSSLSSTSNLFILLQEKIEIPHLSKLCIYSCQYDKLLYHPNLFKQLGIVYSDSVNTAVNTRQAEYLAGRFSASSALKQLGIKNFDISTGPHGNPIWPKGLLGSITHSIEKAYAAVGYCTDFSYIGIDYEQIIKLETAKNIKSTIMSEIEYSGLVDSKFDFETVLTIVFSAKESLFKALYPYVGKYFDFSVAKVINISKENQSFELRLSQSLTERLEVGTCFKGWFKAEPTSILTVIAL